MTSAPERPAPSADRGAPVPAVPAYRRERVEWWSAAAVAVAVLGGVAWAAATLPVQAAVILGVAAAGAYAAWLATNYRHPVVSRAAVATYLCAVAFQIAHMAEEYAGGFPHEFVELFDSPRRWSEPAFLLVFVFGFNALWCLGAAGALYRVRVANYLLWFYALGAGLVNAVSHFVFPVLRGGYFPGLYTAAGHLALSALLVYVLARDRRRVVREAGYRDGAPVTTETAT
ncbi:MAG TPA: HXXEE domain-containing protein [Actinomycetota bacterium]|nr:HXXEE domain-containing protein [Actinomycetota bacterium]